MLIETFGAIMICKNHLGRMVKGCLASSIITETCTLSGCTVASCNRIITVGAPGNHAVGNFCPTDISDGSVAGMWIESGSTYDLTG